MENTIKPEINRVYHVRFETIEYDFCYPEKDILQLKCTSSESASDKSDSDRIKVFKVTKFEISDNVWCVYWHSEKFSIVQIEDWNRMVIDVIKSTPDLDQERDAGIISES